MINSFINITTFQEVLLLYNTAFLVSPAVLLSKLFPFKNTTIIPINSSDLKYSTLREKIIIYKS